MVDVGSWVSRHLSKAMSIRYILLDVYARHDITDKTQRVTLNVHNDRSAQTVLG